MVNDGITMVQDLESMDLAQAQAIANQDDPHEQEVRNLILGNNPQPGVRHNIVDTKDLQVNLEVQVPEEKGEIKMAMAQQAQNQNGDGLMINGKFFTFEDIAAIHQTTMQQAQQQPQFQQFQQALQQDPNPPTDQEGFMSWLWNHKIYVAAGVALLFLAYYLHSKNSGSSSEMDMVDSAVAFFTGF